MPIGLFVIVLLRFFLLIDMFNQESKLTVALLFALLPFNLPEFDGLTITAVL